MVEPKVDHFGALSEVKPFSLQVVKRQNRAPEIIEYVGLQMTLSFWVPLNEQLQSRRENSTSVEFLEPKGARITGTGILKSRCQKGAGAMREISPFWPPFWHPFWLPFGLLELVLYQHNDVGIMIS